MVQFQIYKLENDKFYFVNQGLVWWNDGRIAFARRPAAVGSLRALFGLNLSLEKILPNLWWLGLLRTIKGVSSSVGRVKLIPCAFQPCIVVNSDSLAFDRLVGCITSPCVFTVTLTGSTAANTCESPSATDPFASNAPWEPLLPNRSVCFFKHDNVLQHTNFYFILLILR